jgi:hypothetical protein
MQAMPTSHETSIAPALISAMLTELTDLSNRIPNYRWVGESKRIYIDQVVDALFDYFNGDNSAWDQLPTEIQDVIRSFSSQKQPTLLQPAPRKINLTDKERDTLFHQLNKHFPGAPSPKQQNPMR